MGMDVIGRAPRSKRGGVFPAQSGRWHEIAAYCNAVAPKVCGACRYWYSNDADGLDDAGAALLARILKARINDYSIDIYAGRVSAKDQAIFKELPDPLGLLKDREDGYWFIEAVAEFAAFLEDCGGFNIW